jgi:hypothetical protein
MQGICHVFFFQIYIQETSGFEQQQKNEDLSPHNADIIWRSKSDVLDLW